MLEKIIPLKRPLKAANGQITSLKIREPGGMEHLQIGEPQFVARTQDGTFYTVDNDDAIKAYVEKCVDCDPLLLVQLSLTDAVAVKAALLDFFLAARKAQSA